MDVFDTEDALIVLPNHPAIIDPALILSYVRDKRALSPIVGQKYSQVLGVSTILSWLHAIILPSIDDTQSKVDISYLTCRIRSAIENKHSILLYPAGRIYSQASESIRGKRMTYDIMRNCGTKVRVIALHTNGLWGSMWSKAYSGNNPNLGKTLAFSFFLFVMNLGFFIPKRDISIECTDITDTITQWSQEGLPVFNQRLQDFYNKNGDEICRYIPHYFFYNDIKYKTEPKKIMGSLEDMRHPGTQNDDTSTDIFLRVRDSIAQIKNLDVETLLPGTHLILDLHMDSLDIVELSTILYQQFPRMIRRELHTLKTIADVVSMILDGESTIHSEQILTQEQIGRIQRYISARGYDAVGLLFPQQHILALDTRFSQSSIRVTWLSLDLGEAEFARLFREVPDSVIITSYQYFRGIKSSWIAQYEGNLIFIEDIPREISLGDKIRSFFS